MDRNDKEEGAPDESPETDSPEIPDYTVGYGNPPLKGRFKAGQSGNRRGRPRGSKNRKTIVREIANEAHAVTEDGQRRQRSTLELILLTLRNLMAEGNVRPFRAYKKYLAKYEPQDSRRKYGYLFVPAPVSLEDSKFEIVYEDADADTPFDPGSKF